MMKDDELIVILRTKAQGLEFSLRWLILEVLRRFETKLREQERSKWISDRHPTEEESERVIVGIVNGNNGMITFTDAEVFVSYDFKEKAWWSADYDIEGCEVKCWYALPEPPKEGVGMEHQ